LACALVAAAVSAGCSCYGFGHPRIDPTGARIFTYDTPYKQVPGRIGETDRLGVLISPAKVIAPVGSEVIVQAAVCGKDKTLIAGEKVEWSIAPSTVGYFLQAGESGSLDWLHHVGYHTRKVDNTFAVSATSPKFIMLNRGTPNASDDVPVLRGQAWVTVSSPVEGTSHVTAAAPNVYGWDARKQTSQIYWIDAQWTLPPPAINPAGSRHTFTTTLIRHSNKCPLAGYRVRYEIAGGPPAGFAPNGTQVVEVTSNTLGQAPIEIFQPSPAQGTNTINIQVIRPADWPGGDGTPLVVGSGSTQKTWTTQSAGLSIDKVGPREVPIGGTITYRIDVRNPGDLTARGLTVTDAVPASVQYIGSNPPATVNGTTLSWALGDLGPGQTRSIELSFRALQSTVVNNCATVTSLDGVTAQDCAATTITTPTVEITMAGPPQVGTGEDVVFVATVTNRGATPATGLVLFDRFDQGLRHNTAGAGPIENRELGTLNPGESKQVSIPLQAVTPGRWCNNIELVGDGGIRGTAQACVVVVAATVTPTGPPPVVAVPGTGTPGAPPAATGKPVLVVRKTGPTSVPVGGKALFTIEVQNQGGPATNVRVVDTYDVAIRPSRATDGWKAVGTTLYWEAPTLAPGQTLRWMVECDVLSPASRACNRADVNCAEGVTAKAEACLEITGR
jgi:uncharacterized repeat protein (TIGR01451 family)